MIVQIFDVGVAAQKPKELVDDGFKMQLFGGDQRKSGTQIEAQLVTEDRTRADAGAVAFFDALTEHAFHQIEILPHRFLALADSGCESAASLPQMRRLQSVCKEAVDGDPPL